MIRHLKKGIPRQIKKPFRILADRLLRQGEFFERQARSDLIHQAFVTLGFNAIEGDYVEFGSATATTFAHAARASKRDRHRKRKLWAFDSFAGLPPADGPEDKHPRWIPGTMKTGIEEFKSICRRKNITNYGIVPGFYSESLRNKSDNFFPAKSIAFIYIDCDMYSSTAEVLNFILPRLQHGMIIAFDDYWCYSTDNISGERKAFLEILKPSDKWNFEPYIQFGWSGMSFVVEYKALLPNTD